MKPKKLIVDCSTGLSVELEMTDEEILQMESQAAIYAEQVEKEKIEAEAKAAAKASALSKLEALGLTEEEANAIAVI